MQLWQAAREFLCCSTVYFWALPLKQLVTFVFITQLILSLSSLQDLGNKKIKKPHKKGKSKKSKYSEDDDFINDEPTSTQEVELQNLIKTLVALHDKSKQGIYQDAGQDSNYTCTTVSICEAIGKQLMGAIEWAKGIPGYETLTLNDQAILLQSGWIEMLLLNWIYYSLQHNNKLQFAEGLVVDSDSSKLLGLEPVFCQLISLISRVQVYGLDEEEFVCIKGIGLLNAGMTLINSL